MRLRQGKECGQNYQTTIGVPHNRCGHDPDNLRSYEKPKFHNERPPLLQKAIAALEQGAQYFSRKKRKFLNAFNCLNPSARQKRSERREALLLVLGRILHYTDIATFDVGVPKAGGAFYYASVDEIARDTGLHQQRVLRALHDAVDAYYIKLTRHRAQDSTTGQYYYRIAVRYLLFLDLGISCYFVERARTYALKQRDKKTAGASIIQGIAHLGTHLQRAGKRMSRSLRSKTTPQAAITKSTEKAERDRLDRYIQLRTQHPERSNAELYQEIYGRPLSINTS